MINRQNTSLAIITPNSKTASQGRRKNVISNVLPFSHGVQYKKGEKVTVKGQQSRYLYYVQKGGVEVSYTIRGTNIVVALMGPGEFFGEIGFFDKIARVRDIRATANTIIRIFDDNALQRIQLNAPILYGDFLDLLIRNVCTRFRRILSDREPLTAYAASLSQGKHSFEKSLPIPEHFLRTSEWRFTNRVVEEFKAGFFDLSLQLQKGVIKGIPHILQKKCDKLLDGFSDRLQEVLNRLDRHETSDRLWGFLFKEIFPYFMLSHFAKRAYFKPNGYAGDFGMMEMIYQNQPDGDSKLGILVDRWCLNTKAARAVRGRRELLSRQIELKCHTRLDRQSPIRIMNLAGGSNRELFDFLSHCDYSNKIEATCVDADPDALEFTASHIDIFPHQATIRLMNDNVITWALGRVQNKYGLQDIIYTAGLTDYLNRRLFLKLLTRCYEHLIPGGVLIVSNFSPDNPNRAFMDHVLHWKLIYRDRQELISLFSNSPFARNIDISAEAQGINLFVIAKKSE